MGGSIPMTAAIAYISGVLGVTNQDDMMLGLRLVMAMDDEFRIHEQKTAGKKSPNPPAAGKGKN